jgi:hypothetical protein
MGRRKGETQQEHMDRLRAARGLPPLTREGLMNEVAAARCYLDRAVSTTNPEQQRKLELTAFMAIFHPEVDADKVREMCRG